MKIALFSDIHGNLTGLRAVLAALDAEGGADHIIAAGDIVAGGAATDAVINLRERGVQMVRGDSDTDDKLRDRLRTATHAESTSCYPARYSAAYYKAMLSWMDANLSPAGRDFLARLPLSLRVDTVPGQELYVCHASPRDVRDRVCSADNPVKTLREAYGSVLGDGRTGVIAFGHAHTPYVRLLDGTLMVNVASVAFRPDATSMLTFLTYGNEHWVVRQLAVPYDAAEEESRMRERGVPTID